VTGGLDRPEQLALDLDDARDDRDDESRCGCGDVPGRPTGPDRTARQLALDGLEDGEGLIPW
jgi:hypothetical protein